MILLKNEYGLLGVVKLIRNKIKRKFLYCGYRIAFDGERSWSFGNEFAWNVVILVLTIID